MEGTGGFIYMNPGYGWAKNDGTMLSEHLSTNFNFVPLTPGSPTVDSEPFIIGDGYIREERETKGNHPKTNQPLPVLSPSSPGIRRNGQCADGSKKPGNHPCPEAPSRVSRPYK